MSIVDRLGLVVIVQKWGDGLTLTYPGHLTPATAISIRRGDAPGLFYNSDADPAEKFQPTPEYAIRPFLGCYLAAALRAARLDPRLLRFFGEDRQVLPNLESTIDPSNDPKELSLVAVFGEARRQGFSAYFEEVARINGILEGYLLCREAFLRG